MLAASQASLTEARAQSANRLPVETPAPRRVYGGVAPAAAKVAVEAGPEGAAAAQPSEGAESPGTAYDEDGPPLEVIVGSESSEVPAAPAAPPTARPRNDDDAVPAPPVADLSARVPPSLQEAMEELFRARFVRVTRVPATAAEPAAKAGS